MSVYRRLAWFLIWLLPVFARAEVHTYGIIGDAGMINGPVMAAKQSLARDSIFHLILPGDNLYDSKNNYSSVWDGWKASGFKFDVVAIGNHGASYADEVSYFQMPGEYYTKFSKDVRFVVLNSDNRATVNDQMTWAERVLSTATEKFIFLVYHHPTYTISAFHVWTERQEFQLKMRTLLAKHKSKITAVLIGHDHISSLIDFGGIPAVVAGAAGEQREGKRLSYTAEDGAAIKTGWVYSRQPSWARMDVNTDDGSVWINFVQSTDQRVLCSVRIAPDRLYRDNCAKR